MALATTVNMTTTTTDDAQTLHDALALYEQGAFFACHDVLESLWLRDRTALRPLYQGLIQLAAAFVHWQRGETTGILKLLQAAQEKLSPFPADTLGLDLQALLTGITAAEAYFASPDASPAGFTADRLPPLRRLPGPAGKLS
jgi:predicted metal-dependent hydrolase